MTFLCLAQISNLKMAIITGRKVLSLLKPKKRMGANHKSDFKTTILPFAQNQCLGLAIITMSRHIKKPLDFSNGIQ